MIINSNTSNVYFVGRNDSISTYLASIRKFPILTADEESSLIDSYKTGKDMKARTKLINCNQRFIFSAAKRYSSNPDTVMDLVSEGNIGFMEAIERYEPERGHRLLTFAQAYIRKYMNLYFIQNKLIVRSCDEKLGPKIKVERSLFHNENGRYPTNDELKRIIMDKYDIDIQDNAMIEDIDLTYIDSLGVEDPDYGASYDYNNATYGQNDFIENQRKLDLKAIVLAAIGQVCRPKEAEIVKMIYGIDVDKEYSVSEIAGIYGVTETRINQIRFAVEKKLRENKQFSYMVGA